MKHQIGTYSLLGICISLLSLGLILGRIMESNSSCPCMFWDNPNQGRIVTTPGGLGDGVPK